MDLSELPPEASKKLGRPPKSVPDATPRMRRRPRPKPIFRSVEDFDLRAADRAALVECLELSRDPNSSPAERAQALRSYAALRRAFDGGERAGCDDEPLGEMLRELFASRETAQGVSGRANGSAPKP